MCGLSALFPNRHRLLRPIDPPSPFLSCALFAHALASVEQDLSPLRLASARAALRVARLLLSSAVRRASVCRRLDAEPKRHTPLFRESAGHYALTARGSARATQARPICQSKRSSVAPLPVAPLPLLEQAGFAIPQRRAASALRLAPCASFRFNCKGGSGNRVDASSVRRGSSQARAALAECTRQSTLITLRSMLRPHAARSTGRIACDGASPMAGAGLRPC
eukprot:3449034-Pleurochrysis_carterae.AAC.2